MTEILSFIKVCVAIARKATEIHEILKDFLLRVQSVPRTSIFDVCKISGVENPNFPMQAGNATTRPVTLTWLFTVAQKLFKDANRTAVHFMANQVGISSPSIQ
ncbi:hypothetical protein PoB_006764300 [Plakobranchus ocellatus]|uniref:Uncharacterized protein n=1 Tax=Plakobranchus ocellatus TaxID=259542 RepID=A0AAV4DAP9_9GAST|nr:hypothetical protein PoB_006764300 [Plakobranchus ocellatus]